MLINTIIRYIAAVIIIGLMLFLSAGTIFYWQAWVFIAIFFVPMLFIALYLIKRDPELLKRRLDTKEKTPLQSNLARLFYISLYLVLIISGLDKCFHWSSIPLIIVIISEILFLVGYYFLFLVFKGNKYLAHTVVVEKDQGVVTVY